MGGAATPLPPVPLPGEARAAKLAKVARGFGTLLRSGCLAARVAGAATHLRARGRAATLCLALRPSLALCPLLGPALLGPSLVGPTL